MICHCILLCAKSFSWVDGVGHPDHGVRPHLSLFYLYFLLVLFIYFHSCFPIPHHLASEQIHLELVITLTRRYPTINQAISTLMGHVTSFVLQACHLSQRRFMAARNNSAMGTISPSTLLQSKHPLLHYPRQERPRVELIFPLGEHVSLTINSPPSPPPH